MSLLTDLQDDVLDSKRSLTTALRRAKVLSFNLKNEELRSWVENELNGYRDSTSVPEYRHLAIQNRGHFMNSAWKAPNQLISLSVLPEKLRIGMDKHVVYQSIPSLEATLLQPEGDTLQVSWSPELVNLLSYKVYDNLACLAAWKEIARSQIVDIIEVVRNRLLTITLELMDQIPNLENDQWDKRADERVKTIIHNNISGNQNVVAFGEEVNQSVTISVKEGDLRSLDAALQSLGLTSGQVEDLKKAVEQDGVRSHKEEFGPRVLQIIGKIATRSLDWASSASAALVAQAISSYYGWK